VKTRRDFRTQKGDRTITRPCLSRMEKNSGLARRLPGPIREEGKTKNEKRVLVMRLVFPIHRVKEAKWTEETFMGGKEVKGEGRRQRPSKRKLTEKENGKGGKSEEEMKGRRERLNLTEA